MPFMQLVSRRLHDELRWGFVGQVQRDLMRGQREPAAYVLEGLRATAWHIIEGFALPHPSSTLGVALPTRLRVIHKEYPCVIMKLSS